MLNFFDDHVSNLTLFATIARLFLAILVGGSLGMERGRKHRAAGLRTHIIVCMASALVMMTGEFLVTKFGTGDPARLGAQVISGIGFLGAGAIIVTSRQIRGLTTAAGLWAAACMGLAVGAGYYAGAIICSIAILIAMTSLNRLDKYIRSHSKNLTFFAEFMSMEGMRDFVQQLRKLHLKLNDIEMSTIPTATGLGRICATFWVTMPVSGSHMEVISDLSNLEIVSYIEEISGM